ncbi:hypothetical protein D3C78_1742990 [compost metagenome]
MQQLAQWAIVQPQHAFTPAQAPFVQPREGADAGRLQAGLLPGLQHQCRAAQWLQGGRALDHRYPASLIDQTQAHLSSVERNLTVGHLQGQAQVARHPDCHFTTQ